MRLELFVQAVENGDVVLAGCRHDLFDVFDRPYRGHAVGHGGVELALGVEEAVVGVDEDNGCVGEDHGWEGLRDCG